MAAVNGASKGAVALGVFALARGRRARRAAIIALSLAILAAGLALSAALGAVYVSPAEALAAILGDADRVPRQIVWNLRIPRAGLAWAWSARASSPSRSPLCWRRPPRAWRAWSDSSGL